ncbi:DUF551 domain-containing protein [Raoultella ornithinolytica]|uniref:DUF551 domain-containing protein n=1 Tax=Raoultella ornithinolytica TaxID=54291 RepID=UPI00388F0C05
MTSKLTREELRKRAKENINNLRFASKQRAFESARKEILADLQLAEYALEAMESEPYGFTEGERFGMVLEPRQWPAPKDGEPQLHIKEQPGPDIDTLRHAFETEEREETGGFNLHKSGIDYVDKSTQAQWEAWLVYRAAMLQAGNSPALSPSREHFISLCNEFWGWSDMDMICADDKGYEPRLEWNGQSFTHPVTRGLWRMYQAAPTGIPMNSNGWIPVSERMPERGDYLVTDGRDFDVQSFDGEQFIPGFVWEDAITHWMPLPAAPQEVNHG